MEWYYVIGLTVLTLAVLASGFPVAFSLAGSALFVAGIGTLTGHFDPVFFSTIPERLFGIMTNDALVAIPLFILMGAILEKSKLAEDLLSTMSELFGTLRGGLGISVFIVGALLAASTGVVGATVVAMGLISLPQMLRARYSKPLAAGIVCASGTLGQIIPPSVVLIVLGDVLGSAHQQAQLARGDFAPTSISVADLFIGALVPGLALVGLYLLYILIIAHFFPRLAPAPESAELRLSKGFAKRILRTLLPPLTLVCAVMGSILAGAATPTEAAGVGVVGALILSIAGNRFSKKDLEAGLKQTVNVTAMVFLILIGASIFSLVFRGFRGDELIESYLLNLHGERVVVLAVVMAVIFVLGFFIDFFEIVFVVVPVVGPALLQLGFDPVWLGVIFAMNLQTSFLTPPFGFTLFYLRGVTREISTADIYRGVVPFIAIQILMLLLLYFFPGMVLTSAD